MRTLFIWFINVRETVKLTLPQTGSSDWAATGLGLATATMAVLLFSKHRKNYWLGPDWGRRAKSPCADRGSCLAKQGVAGPIIKLLRFQIKKIWLRVLLPLMVMSMWVICVTLLSRSLNNLLENTLQGLESSIKEDNTKLVRDS